MLSKKPCGFCDVHRWNMGKFKMVNLCDTPNGKSLGRGSMHLVHYSKGVGDTNEHWAIECPETSDYQFIRFCPMCGQELPQEDRGA